MSEYEEEFLGVVNQDGEQDRLLLLHIRPAIDKIIRTLNDSVFLRSADRTMEMKGFNLRNLEYSKSTRYYEDECHPDAKISDLDESLIHEYKQRVAAEELTTEQLLKARGFLKNHNGKNCLTNAAVLLFTANINQFYPNCRIRFLRYEGNEAGVGTKFHTIKDENIEYPIMRIIGNAKRFIATQLRNFTAIDTQSGTFQTAPEYPEFAWLEGIVNAVTHREYGLAGKYILVTMYNDRLEIQSPGRLPNLVTVDNMDTTRFSRNPRIARVLTEMGWVRELNEGVKRIYSEMNDLFLDRPEYKESEQSVQLTLKNNIDVRIIRQTENLLDRIGIDIWEELEDMEKTILTYMGSIQKVTRADLVKHTGKSPITVTRRLNSLIQKKIIKRVGNKSDPHQYYTFSEQITDIR